MSYTRNTGIEWYLWVGWETLRKMEKDGRRTFFEFLISAFALGLVAYGELSGSTAGAIVVTTMGLDVPKLAEAYKQVKLENKSNS